MNRILISNYNYSNININDIIKHYEKRYYRIICLMLNSRNLFNRYICIYCLFISFNQNVISNYKSF